MNKDLNNWCKVLSLHFYNEIRVIYLWNYHRLNVFSFQIQREKMLHNIDQSTLSDHLTHELKKNIDLACNIFSTP